MKKYVFLVVSFLLLSTIMAQEKKYIDGYEDLPWGASVEQVKQKYPDIVDSALVDGKKYEIVEGYKVYDCV